MGCHKLTYQDKGRALEVNPFFVDEGLEVKGVSEKNRVRAYRYGFNGMEKDDEVKGSGNSVNFKFRVYDPRLGRFLSVDPLMPSYPWYTPYQFAGNNPIRFIDVEGLEEATPRSFRGANDPIFRGRTAAWAGMKSKYTVVLVHKVYINGKIFWDSGEQIIKEGDPERGSIIVTRTVGAGGSHWERRYRPFADAGGGDAFTAHKFLQGENAFQEGGSSPVENDDPRAGVMGTINALVNQYNSGETSIGNKLDYENSFTLITIGGENISEKLKQQRGQMIVNLLKSRGVEGQFLIQTAETDEFQIDIQTMVPQDTETDNESNDDSDT